MVDPLYKNQWDFFDECHKNGNLSHAYLFYGNSKIKDFSIELFKKINCQKKDYHPCQTCNNCIETISGLNSDLKIIEAKEQDLKGNQKKGNEIYIDQIREAQNFAGLTSINNRTKMIIIDSAHYMNQEAQNALLKILEEPKGNVIFILISQYPDILLETVLSRCSKIFFPFLQEEINQEDRQYIKDIKEIINQNLAQRFSYVKSLFPGKDKAQELNNAKRILSIWLMFFRNALLEKIGAKSLIQDKIFPTSDLKYTESKIFNIINRIQTAMETLDFTNTNQKLIFEIILLEL